jgi:hypothetical protein
MRAENTLEININSEYDKDSKTSVYFSKHKLVENYTNCFRYQSQVFGSLVTFR